MTAYRPNTILATLYPALHGGSGRGHAAPPSACRAPFGPPGNAAPRFMNHQATVCVAFCHDVNFAPCSKAETRGKTRITIMLDNFVIQAFRQLAEQEGVGYQTLINRRLRESLETKPLDEDTLRRVVREELGDYKP